MTRLLWAAALASVAVIGTVWLATRPPTRPCIDLSSAEPGEAVVLATTVVAHPWLGPHHVYALFVVPEKYRDRTYSATMTVAGEGVHVDSVRVAGNPHGPGPQVAEGSYLLHEHFETRRALLFLITGRFGDLRAACNWRLAFRTKQIRSLPRAADAR